MIGYTITSGTPTPQELAALEQALKHREQPGVVIKVIKSAWAAPQLRAQLVRKA